MYFTWIAIYDKVCFCLHNWIPAYNDTKDTTTKQPLFQYFQCSLNKDLTQAKMTESVQFSIKAVK